MAGFWGAAFQGQQDAMHNFIARKQAEQRLQIEQQQQERLRQQAQLQDYEFAQRQRMQPYEEQLKQQQLEKGALDIAALKQAQGFAGELPQQPIPPTVQPGVQSQPIPQGIPGGQQQPVQPQIQPWRSVPQPGQQMQPQGVIPPRPAKEQMEQQFDVGQTQDLAKMQQGLQVISQQLMQSPNEPENAFRRWAGNDPARNSPAGQEWFAKNKLPFHEKMYKAEVDNFNRQKQIFDEVDKRQREERQAKHQELADQKLLMAIQSAKQGGMSGLSESDKDAIARAYTQDKSVLSGMGFAKGEKAALIARAAKIAESEGTNIAATHEEYRATSGAYNQITKDLTAFRPYKEMLDTNANIAKDLATKITKTNSALLNKSINWIAQNVTGDPDVAEYMAQVRIAQTEFARALINPRLVGQLTDTARREMEGIINGNMPLNSFIRVVDRLQKDGDNRIKAMEKEQESLRKSFSKSSKPESVKTDAGKKDDPLGIR